MKKGPKTSRGTVWSVFLFLFITSQQGTKPCHCDFSHILCVCVLCSWSLIHWPRAILGVTDREQVVIHRIKDKLMENSKLLPQTGIPQVFLALHISLKVCGSFLPLWLRMMLCCICSYSLPVLTWSTAPLPFSLFPQKVGQSYCENKYYMKHWRVYCK